MAHQPYNIYADHEISCVVMNWQGYATSFQFREGTELMLKLLIENSYSKVLADLKDMAIIASEDQLWLENEFLPKAIAAGFKAIAMARPRSYFNKVAIESVSYKVNKEKLLINIYDNLEQAKEWLVSLG